MRVNTRKLCPHRSRDNDGEGLSKLVGKGNAFSGWDYACLEDSDSSLGYSPGSYITARTTNKSCTRECPLSAILASATKRCFHNHSYLGDLQIRLMQSAQAGFQGYTQRVKNANNWALIGWGTVSRKIFIILVH